MLLAEVSKLFCQFKVLHNPGADLQRPLFVIFQGSWIRSIFRDQLARTLLAGSGDTTVATHPTNNVSSTAYKLSVLIKSSVSDLFCMEYVEEKFWRNNCKFQIITYFSKELTVCW